MSSPHIDVQKKKINEVVGFPYGTMLILISLVDEVSVWDFHTNTHTHTHTHTRANKTNQDVFGNSHRHNHSSK